MPPQSRGSGESERDSSAIGHPDTHHPILQPYLDNLTSPEHHVTDQGTSDRLRTASLLDRGVSATPTPLRHVPAEPRIEDEDGAELDIDEESLGENEEEFQSHYSRNSPASSEDEREEDEEASIMDGDGTNAFDDNDNRLKRIASLPVSATEPQFQRPTLLHSQSSASLRAPPPPPPLYPPFYNRPPTPLPPSPSLTSLLRPPSILNRSTTSTRPTTPDSSDVETPLDTEAAVAHSARRAHPLPPTSPKVPTYEYYGFVLYLASSLAFLMYILWSYLPSPFLHALGITYYPNRWWSLAIPAWIVMLLVFTYVALTSYNLEYLTLPMSSLECMVDDAANVAVLDERGRIRKGGSKKLVGELQLKRQMEEERDRKSASWGKGTAKRKKKREQAREREKKRGEADVEDDWLTYVSLYGLGSKDRRMELSWKQMWNQGMDAVMDVPIGGVCEVLYGEE